MIRKTKRRFSTVDRILFLMPCLVLGTILFHLPLWLTWAFVAVQVGISLIALIIEMRSYIRLRRQHRALLQHVEREEARFFAVCENMDLIAGDKALSHEEKLRSLNYLVEQYLAACTEVEQQQDRT